MLFSSHGVFSSIFTVKPSHDVLSQLGQHFSGVLAFTLHAFKTLSFWMVIFGILTAWFNTLICPQFPQWCAHRLSWLRIALIEQYGFDRFNERVFAKGSKSLSKAFLNYGDIKLIDYGMVEGSGRGVSRLSLWLRRLQTGYLYHYVLVMILGLLGLLFLVLH